MSARGVPPAAWALEGHRCRGDAIFVAEKRQMTRGSGKLVHILASQEVAVSTRVIYARGILGDTCGTFAVKRLGDPTTSARGTPDPASRGR